MKHETSTALYDYWLSRHHDVEVRAGGIRAAELAPLLPELFLLEIDPSERPFFRLRYCGGVIARRYGRDLTDEDFLALWSPDDRATWQRELRAVAFRSTGVVTGVLAKTMGGGVISYEMLLLPLAGDVGAAGAIGTMARTGGHEESNRIRARVVAQSLRSMRFLPDVTPDVARRHPVRAQNVSSGYPPARRRYRHLTVVAGGK